MITSLFRDYPFNANLYDETFSKPESPRESYATLLKELSQYSQSDYAEVNEYVRRSFFNQGITFNDYSGNDKGEERIFPFDLFPRVIEHKEWADLEKGILQRSHAINLFLNDIYHDKKILKDKVFPSELLFSCGQYNKFMLNFTPVGGIYTHISGTDLIKHTDGKYYVLEDNVRCPSGVSYVLSSRDTMKKAFSQIFSQHKIQSVSQYPDELLSIMQSVSPLGVDEPVCVVLSPGIYNSAYYEHSFLALSMGISLVEGRDLFIDKNFVYMKTIHGPKRVDVIYRRVDDEYLDPLAFDPHSLLGVPGIMSAYRDGNVTLLNAPGTGAADDKAIYSYIPAIIKYYLGEDSILHNVQTYRCEDDLDLNYVLDNMENLVIKPVDQSGGKGILIGTHSTKDEREKYKAVIKADRRRYIAQPIMSLSVHPTYIDETAKFEQRHIDLRTFTLMGKDCSHVMKGGLTRVALKRGNLVVNSSQGGGSKDTWVLGD
jgi:uncharacterized circularly permuted ATP-grasp superfamily protein